jgi:DNA-binding transcriptional LysR family regulator
VSAVLSPELVEVFTRFRHRHPSIRLELHDLLPARQLEALARGELDVAFVGVAPDKLPAGLAAARWREEELLAFLPPDHAFAGKSEVRLGELADEPFVMISAEAAPAFTSLLHRLCLQEGFRPRVVQEASRAQAVAALTVAGAGVSILPASLNRLTGNGVPLKLRLRRKASLAHSVAHAARPTEAASLLLGVLEGN